ncbi:hypothetical protein ABDF71_27015 [Ochrobactrum sp. WV_118_8]|uniref:hypothetical protein n=1 Tax=Brucella TaxID=234 RepID=UPI000F65EA09|nr:MULTISPECIES: hypothetical protein [Brucella]RRY02041.1 hypothetical protein EGJ58_24460 [Brucella anthropi]WPM83005.1 hypothetical protein R5W60_21285 [Brucella pseudintermedia]
MYDFFLGIAGVVVGAVGQYLIEHFRFKRETEAQRKLDGNRKALLKVALENPPQGKEWRELSTLSHIIGADFETTTRLLIELGARGSEGEKEVWALLSKKPLRGSNA